MLELLWLAGNRFVGEVRHTSAFAHEKVVPSRRARRDVLHRLAVACGLFVSCLHVPAEVSQEIGRAAGCCARDAFLAGPLPPPANPA